MRFLFRALSFALVAVAVGLGVLDCIRSVAVSAPRLTGVGDLWTKYAPATFSAGADMMQAIPFAGSLGRMVWSWLVSQPAFAILLALSLAAWIAGYRKPKPAGRFAA